MGGPRGCHTEWTISDREGDILYDICYIQNIKRKDTNELMKYKQIRRADLWSLGEGSIGERNNKRVWYRHAHTARFKMNNRGLNAQHGDSARCYGAAWMGVAGVGGMNACVCVAETLLSTSNYCNTVKQQCPDTKCFFFNKELGWTYERINNTSETEFQQLFFF